MSANETTKPTIAVKAPVVAPTTKAAPKALAKTVAKKVVAKPVVAKVAVKATAPKKAAPKAAAKPVKAAAKPAAAPKAKPAKIKKPKMVRDSFTMPKAEFAVIDALKTRASNLKKSVKKTELIRAGIKALAAMSDAAFVAAVAAVPNLKTGRPANS